MVLTDLQNLRDQEERDQKVMEGIKSFILLIVSSPDINWLLCFTARIHGPGEMNGGPIFDE